MSAHNISTGISVSVVLTSYSVWFAGDRDRDKFGGLWEKSSGSRCHHYFAGAILKDKTEMFSDQAWRILVSMPHWHIGATSATCELCRLFNTCHQSLQFVMLQISDLWHCVKRALSVKSPGGYNQRKLHYRNRSWWLNKILARHLAS